MQHLFLDCCELVKRLVEELQVGRLQIEQIARRIRYLRRPKVILPSDILDGHELLVHMLREVDVVTLSQRNSANSPMNRFNNRQVSAADRVTRDVLTHVTTTHFFAARLDPFNRMALTACLRDSALY